VSAFGVRNTDQESIDSEMIQHVPVHDADALDE
jgi:hypothetical protein